MTFNHIMNVESEYLDLLKKILYTGHRQEGRNGGTTSLPFLNLSWQFDNEHNFVPLITTRQMYPAGILGEYAAMIRGPKHIDDFRRAGCNYWDKWANEDGTINVDYGNAWIDYNGINQMEAVLDSLKTNPGDRRMIIDAWRPDRLDDLSLPCCHYAYQFWTDGEGLSLLWHQRSADWCIGVPSDMLVASVMLFCFADLSGLRPDKLMMQFGDCHVYDEHRELAFEQLHRLPWLPPRYNFRPQTDLYSFIPSDLEILEYKSHPSMKYELKA